MRPSTARPAARAGTVTQTCQWGAGPARALALSVALARPTAADSDSDVPLTQAATSSLSGPLCPLGVCRAASGKLPVGSCELTGSSGLLAARLRRDGGDVVGVWSCGPSSNDARVRGGPRAGPGRPRGDSWEMVSDSVLSSYRRGAFRMRPAGSPPGSIVCQTP